MDTEFENEDGPNESHANSVSDTHPAPSDSQRLLAMFPTGGKFLGNKWTREQLGWDSDHYFRVRNRLIDEGVLVRGRGRGGSVARVVEAKMDAKPQGQTHTPTDRVAERDLYEPIRRTLLGEWSSDRDHEYSAVEITASQGSRATGGKWTRPDIVAINIGVYKYVPNKVLDVLTFEVKPKDALDITCVYEALSHRRSANYSYVLLHVPESEQEGDVVKKSLDQIQSEAREHGIGVVIFGDPEDYATWEEVVEPIRQERDPGEINEFIQIQLSTESKRLIEKHVR